MKTTRIAALLAALLVATLPFAARAVSVGNLEMPAAKSVPAPERFRLTPQDAGRGRITLEPVEASAIESLKRANGASPLKRLDVGVGRAVSAAHVEAAPEWVAAPGGWSSQWLVTSTGASALRIGVAAKRLPDGAELRFSGKDRSDVVYGPFGPKDVLAMGATFWSPVLEGETALVELFVPEAAQRPALAIDRLSHLFVNPAAPDAEKAAKIGESASCEVDFLCRANSDSALLQTGRSVARMTFTLSTGGTALCTGTLLNSTDSSLTPYFYSAAHCFTEQTVASTLTTHWFYEATSCGSNTLSGSYVQVAGGATILYANVTGDINFMRLNRAPPAGAVFAGWDSTTITQGLAATAIHHPAGDVKKVSLGTIAGFDTSTLAPGSYIRVTWNSTATGVTEGGSSGSGIFTGNSGAGYRFRGGLLGGPSSCTANAANLYDVYSRFDQAYATIAQFLDPSSSPAPTGPNVVANPGFENGPASWSQQSTGGTAIITNNASVARAGSWYAWLGGAVSLTDTLTQDLTIPTGGRLSFYYRIDTAETPSGAYDSMTVSLVSPSTGLTLATVATLTNQNATNGGWLQSANYDVSAFAGQTVRLRFQAVNDFSAITNFRVDDVSVAGSSASGGANVSSLWVNPAEAGWGFTTNQQGDILFATLYTYDVDRTPMWLFMSDGRRQGAGDTFSGILYRTTGPVFNTVPFTGIAVSQVGTMTVTINGDNATLAYTNNGVTVTKNISKFVFGSRAATCTSTTSSRTSLTNYQDLWSNASEPGWGLSITHQDNTIFATVYSYRPDRQGVWYVMSGGVRQADGSFTGALYSASGPVFNAQPWGSVSLAQVGTMTLRFTNGENGTLTYTVNGVTVNKAITRQQFGTSYPSCG